MKTIKLLTLTITAAFAITACDSKPAVNTAVNDAKQKAADVAKNATDTAASKAAEAAHKAGVTGADEKIKNTADTAKQKIDDMAKPAQPTQPKPKVPEPTTDEVINAPPDALPAPAPRPITPPAK